MDYPITRKPKYCPRNSVFTERSLEIRLTNFILTQENLTFKISKNWKKAPFQGYFYSFCPKLEQSQFSLKIESRQFSDVTPKQKIKQKLMTKHHTTAQKLMTKLFNLDCNYYSLWINKGIKELIYGKNHANKSYRQNKNDTFYPLLVRISSIKVEFSNWKI